MCNGGGFEQPEFQIKKNSFRCKEIKMETKPLNGVSHCLVVNRGNS